jgi:hypothetical protein
VTRVAELTPSTKGRANVRLIGAGLPRTATLSQKVALEKLGYGPCYHMVNVLGDLDLVDGWCRALNGQVPLPELLNGYESTVDWPGAFFYRDLIDLYPDAKVLLSVREPDTWARSMRDTIWGVLYGDILIHHLSAARACLEPRWRAFTEMMCEMWERSGMVNDAENHMDAMSRAMRGYNDEVQEMVPDDRLLVWSAADGWEPLCAFLEVPVPDEPFPRANDTKEFGDRIAQASMQTISGALG